MRGWAGPLCAAGLALLTYWQFPGHTWLQQDTQIYVPALEHLRDPGLLRNDMLAQQTTLSFTLYDESALVLGRLTGRDFHAVLGAEQVVTRALGIWGLILMASALGLSLPSAVQVAAICSLGATIIGPSVLTVEYEPTPRAFAIPLLLCAIGLVACRRYVWAASAAAVAFLYHPPSALPFYLVFGIVLLRGRQWRAFLPLAAAVLVLFADAALQGWPSGGPSVFARIAPELEQLQRLRAAYVWISLWHPIWILSYVALFGALAVACVRTKVAGDLRLFLIGLSLLGLISMPVSWLLLDKARWALIPQIQPMRALLFVALAAQFLGALAGVLAAARRAWVESFAWLTLAYAVPLQQVLGGPLSWRRAAVVVALAGLSVAAGRFGWTVALAAFFAIPVAAGVVNYPQLHTPELAELSGWARSQTASDSVFLFPDAGKSLDPGIFRSEALRAVYVDWKGGGQVNYLPGLAEQWWFRWQQTIARGFHPSDMARYNALGIRYVVLRPADRLPRPAVFENPQYLVYQTQ